MEYGHGRFDVVYTWVNGTDPRWKREKEYWHQRWIAEHTGMDIVEEEKPSDESNADNRFRDNEELRYSLRSIEMYAPWIRHIYIVTDGQIPSWLNVENPRLTIVKHSEIFPNQSHLPVFSSPAIESHLDRIPGLSEYFIYFNDDVFLGAPVYPEDFVSPSGLQNVYLSWNVPSCNDGCNEAFLGDGICDPKCNVTACDFDIGDCGCREMSDSAVVCDPEFEIKERYTYKPRKQVWPLTRCDFGCKFEKIGDDKCNMACNTTECGFDAGDCSEKSHFLLPTGDVSTHGWDTFVVTDLHPSIAIDLTLAFGRNGTIETALHSDTFLIRQAVVLEEKMVLVLVFGKDTDRHEVGGAAQVTIQGKTSNGTSKVVHFNVLRGLKASEDGKVVSIMQDHVDETAFDDSQIQVIGFHNVQDDLFRFKVEFPLHSLQDWAMPVVINATLSLSGAVEYEYTFKEICVPNQKHFVELIHERAINVELHEFPPCDIQGGILSLPLDISLDFENKTIHGLINGTICLNSQLHPDIDPEKAPLCISVASSFGYRNPKKVRLIEPLDPLEHTSFSNVSSYAAGQWQFSQCLGHSTGDEMEELVANPMTDPIEAPEDPRLVHEKTCKARRKHQREQLKQDQEIGSWYSWIGRQIGLDFYEIETDDLEKTTFCELDNKPPTLPTDQSTTTTVLSTDTFGDSLRHVNKLYTRQFGKSTSGSRRVPSHMPHMINRRIMKEMKHQWADEFEKTSTHRFRHPQDMQFSFSYFYYLMNREKLYPTTLEEIWDTYLDMNHDGILDSNEILTVASLAWGDYPPVSYITQVEECLYSESVQQVSEETTPEGKVTWTQVLKPHVRLRNLYLCQDIVAKMLANVRKPPTYQSMPEAEVTFQMLSDNYQTAWNQLQGIRARRTKFVCINDDMKNPSRDIGNILHDLFLSFWPRRSQFELPHHRRNKFGHIDEYHAAQSKIFWLSLTSLVCLVVGFGFGFKILF